MADPIYDHYVAAFSWLGTDEAVGAASAIRSLHFLSRALEAWVIPEGPVPLSQLLNIIDAELPHSEYRERARWVLDSSVGNLMTLLDRSMSFEDEPKEPVMSASIDYICLPDLSAIFSSGQLSSELSTFLRRLRDAFIGLGRVVVAPLINVYDLRSVLFHGFLLANTLIAVLSVIDYARSLPDVRDPVVP